MQTPFLFDLNTQVTITVSGETGQVVGRAEYIDSEPSYYLRYKRADGVATRDWWPQGALTQTTTTAG